MDGLEDSAAATSAKRTRMVSPASSGALTASPNAALVTLDAVLAAIPSLALPAIIEVQSTAAFTHTSLNAAPHQPFEEPNPENRRDYERLEVRGESARGRVDLS